MQKKLSAGATSAAIICKIKEIFAKHGVPDVLRSDNGPQYASAAFTKIIEDGDFNTLHQVLITQLQMPLQSQW